MFTRQQLIDRLDVVRDTAAVAVELLEFGHTEFESPCSEQSIEVCIGQRVNFEDALAFWLDALRIQDWNGRESYFQSYARAGLCQPLSEWGFTDVVNEYSRSLVSPLPMLLRPVRDFRAGLRMYAEWNDVAAVAELGDCYVAFFWATTA